MNRRGFFFAVVAGIAGWFLPRPKPSFRRIVWGKVRAVLERGSYRALCNGDKRYAAIIANQIRIGREAERRVSFR